MRTPVLLLTLTACAPQDEASPPTADAGIHHTAQPGQEIVFDGNGSGWGASLGEDLSFEWALLQVPSASSLTTADLRDAQSPWPSFTPDVDGEYRVALQVCDARGRCDHSEVAAWVGDAAPRGFGPSREMKDLTEWGLGRMNHAPQASAVVLRSRSASGAILLDASESSDPDGDPLAYTWTLVATPPTSELDSGDIEDRWDETAAFRPDAVGRYIVSLRVGDGDASDIVLVNVFVSKAFDGWDLPW